MYEYARAFGRVEKSKAITAPPTASIDAPCCSVVRSSLPYLDELSLDIDFRCEL